MKAKTSLSSLFSIRKEEWSRWNPRFLNLTVVHSNMAVYMFLITVYHGPSLLTAGSNHGSGVKKQNQFVSNSGLLSSMEGGDGPKLSIILGSRFWDTRDTPSLSLHFVVDFEIDFLFRWRSPASCSYNFDQGFYWISIICIPWLLQVSKPHLLAILLVSNCPLCSFRQWTGCLQFSDQCLKSRHVMFLNKGARRLVPDCLHPLHSVTWLDGLYEETEFYFPFWDMEAKTTLLSLFSARRV